MAVAGADLLSRVLLSRQPGDGPALYVAPVPAPHISASRGRFRRAVEQQELGQNFVDKQVEQIFGEEAAPAARRDEPGPITLCRPTAASRRGPTERLGAAALDRAASGARAPAHNLSGL